MRPTAVTVANNKHAAFGIRFLPMSPAIDLRRPDIYAIRPPTPSGKSPTVVYMRPKR
jgi:hypothetical protein